MHHGLELTPDGRLLARQKTETPKGLREKITDFTAQAHHRLDDTVIIQAGTRLCPDGHPNSPTYGHLKLPHLN
jgi:hypothetical protein